MVKTTRVKTTMTKGNVKNVAAKSNLIKKILVVDDEITIRDVLVRFLQKEGYDAKAVSNGAEALRALKKDKFDLLILDMLMPGMTGIDVAEAIRKDPKTKNQKIMFLTVISLGEQGAEKIKILKPAAYITKPFDMTNLRAAIKRTIG